MFRNTAIVVWRLVLGIMLGLIGCDQAQPTPNSRNSAPVSDPNLDTFSKTTNASAESLENTLVEVGSPRRELVETSLLVDAPAKREAANEPVFRPDDMRRKRDDGRLAAVGIRLFQSKRLKLYTDIEPEKAEPLPALIDEVYDAWVSYFGPPPPDRARTEYQMSGYLIRDLALFRESGLLPEAIQFEHGAQRANEFWLRDQEFDYYRRHLLIHEATHAFMTIVPGKVASDWYHEGMAEYFGTHRLKSGQPTEFRVMPTSPQEFAGFGRVTIIRNDFAANKALTLPGVFGIRRSDFVTPTPYAWSWALCAFLDGTPRYQQRFKQLSAYMIGTQFAQKFNESFSSDWRDLATEWTLFVVNLQYGYDLSRAAIDFQPGKNLSENERVHTVNIAADRGWQSSGVLLEKGESYEVSATGRFTLAQQPKPWISEPNGITFRYFDGRPIGMLLGCLRTEEGETGGSGDSMLNIITLGDHRTFVAPVTGTLYLRLNDAWNSLDDNRGEVHININCRPKSK